jgi:hypothetical protein
MLNPDFAIFNVVPVATSCIGFVAAGPVGAVLGAKLGSVFGAGGGISA